MHKGWGALEEAIAVAGITIGTAIAIWDWPQWPWPGVPGATWAAWAGALGSASAAWAAYKAATVPHKLRKRDEQHQGAVEIVATRGRILAAMSQLRQSIKMAQHRHTTWKEATAAQVDIELLLPDELMLDPDAPEKERKIHADERVRAVARERVTRAIQWFRTETRDELEAATLLLSAVPESSVRLFDARMAIAVASAKAHIAFANQKAGRPTSVATVVAAMKSALEELQLYEELADTAEALLAKDRKC